MTKTELMKYVGKKVFIYFKDREAGICGTLEFADEFSAKHDYRRPNDFYINHTSFKASHVRKLEECEDFISRQQAIDKMQELENDDIKAYGCKIPEGFDGERAIEALKSLPRK